MFKFISLVFLAALSSTCFGQEFPFNELNFKGPFGTRVGSSGVYCLMGNGFIRTIHSDEGATVVSEWQRQHPNARSIPVSIMDESSKAPMVYVWAVDGEDNFNLLLIKKGVFPASVMLDAVQFNQLLQMSKETPPRQAIEAAGYAYGQKLLGSTHPVEAPPRRLISEVRYKEFLKQLVTAETAAQAEMNGIWSDKFKGLRDEEDITPLSALPPSILGY